MRIQKILEHHQTIFSDTRRVALYGKPDLIHILKLENPIYDTSRHVSGVFYISKSPILYRNTYDQMFLQLNVSVYGCRNTVSEIFA